MPIHTIAKPLQVCTRHRSRVPISTPPDPSSTSVDPSHPLPESPVITSDLDLPIALRKGKRSTTAHPISHFISYDHLTPSFHQFALSLSSMSLPRSYKEVLNNSAWKVAMDEEMVALLSRGIWDLVTPSIGSDIVGYRWVFIVKYKPYETVDKYKAKLVKGFTQTNGVDYFETFSSVARLNSIRVIISVAVSKEWPMFQFDAKNAFLYGDLIEEVYMEQPFGYVAHGENMVCRLKKAIYGLK